jgi:hypothetical protein
MSYGITIPIFTLNSKKEVETAIEVIRLLKDKEFDATIAVSILDNIKVAITERRISDFA